MNTPKFEQKVFDIYPDPLSVETTPARPTATPMNK